mmetsp:Transcript_20754/g.49317  ORF Transcript_20754/g.49317 Transcript_20754/m.49317 type:complete len:216 (-) Transcript_20754:2-649(-)
MARRARRKQNRLTQLGNQVGSHDIWDGDIESVGEALFGVAVQLQSGPLLPQLLVQHVSHGRHVCDVGVEMCSADVGSNPESDNVNGVLRAWSTAPFMARPMHEVGNFGALTNEQNANARRGIHLVTSQGAHAEWELVQTNWKLASRLAAITVHRNSSSRTKLGDFLDRLHTARLIVGMHDGDEDRVRPQCTLHLGNTNNPGCVDRQICDFKASLL